MIKRDKNGNPWRGYRKSMTWRDHCAPIIAKVIDDVGIEDMKALRKALREAYPYGEKKWRPYKVWLSEINEQIHFRSHTPAKQLGWEDLPLFQTQIANWQGLFQEKSKNN